MRFVPLGLSLVLIGCGTPESPNCYARPAWVLSGDDWWKGLPATAEVPNRNKIEVTRSGSITWNGQSVSKDELRDLLRDVTELSPQPLTQFEWEPDSPCDAIEQVREQMSEVLKCSGSRNCMEGPDLRLP